MFKIARFVIDLTMSEKINYKVLHKKYQHPSSSSSFRVKMKRKGTGNLLQDLISCSVVLDKNTKNGTIDKNNSISGQCSICQQNETTCKFVFRITITLYSLWTYQ